MEWQTTVQDSATEHNNHMYVGPHKHIVCLIGSCDYSASHFMTDYAEKVRKSQNLNISIMGLSSNPFTDHTNDYNELVKLTPEGVFVNITDR